jgi:regulator of ribonuclease activity A
MPNATADLCDDHGHAVRILSGGLRSYGGRRTFHGPVTTVRAPDDNSLVKAALAEPGDGRVLLVDGGAGELCALLGGNLASLAAEGGWAGVVVWGRVRDAVELAAADVGVLALGTCPRRSEKRDLGERDVAVQVGGATVRPGHWLYADEDGALVAETAVHEA